MRTEAELTHHLTQVALDDYGMSRLRPHIATLAELLVEQMLHATRNGRAQAQPNTAPLLAELSSLIADTFSDEGVHECDDCGTVGLEDEMHDEGTTLRDRWVCDDCYRPSEEDPDRAYDAMVDMECEAVGA